MRFYFIRISWIVFILLGLYLILEDYKDTFQTVIYSVWILVGVLYYLYSKNNTKNFVLALLIAFATVGLIIYHFYFKSWIV